MCSKNPFAAKIKSSNEYRFTFALAHHLNKSLAQIQALDSREFMEWFAYHHQYPIDGTREDYRAATIAHVVGAFAGSNADVEDYIPLFGQTVEGQVDKCHNWFKSHCTT
jgi:hypothetical protein